jgi:hypothetical protein
MALDSERAGKVDACRRRLARRSAEDDLATAAWLKNKVAPRLQTRRQQELAEEAARRFEARAVEKPASQS